MTLTEQWKVIRSRMYVWIIGSVTVWSIVLASTKVIGNKSSRSEPEQGIIPVDLRQWGIYAGLKQHLPKMKTQNRFLHE